MALSLDGTTGISASGNIVGNNISVIGSLTAGSFSPTIVSASGNITGGNILTGGSISASGNITGLNINSSNADLAEMYVADANYAPGTVVEFGGQQEITATTQSHSTQVAGIISTAPSYLMNATQTGTHVLPVALTGRVPCLVVGHITKGDCLVASSIQGVAQVLEQDKYRPACIIGKALQNYESDQVGTIEVVVGRT
jgi:trimeric autotransporter adhesin